MTTRYRSLWLAGLLPWMAALAGGCATPPRSGGATRPMTLRYEVTLQAPAEECVDVVVLLDGLAPSHESLTLTMPQRFAFVRLPEPLIEGDVRATAAGRKLDVRRVGPYEWEVTARGHSRIRLDYAVPLTHRTLAAVKQRDAYEYPYVTSDHGLLVSPTLFMFPDALTPDAIRVRFNLPEGWDVFAPWRGVGPYEFDPGNEQSLLNDLIAIGAWSLHQVRVGDFTASIAFAPGQSALEEAAVTPISRIIEAELALFGRPVKGQYLFLFGRPDISGMAGSPKMHSMTLSVEPRLAARVERYLPHLIAHEFFHTWAGDIEMPDELRWVNEGFTDYYAYLVPARLGLSTWQQFADTLGEKMTGCAGNPQRGRLSLADAGGPVFFQDQAAYDVVYEGGMLIAAWLDRSIRERDHGKTLDDLMRAFNNDPRWAAGATPTLPDFLAVAERFINAATLERLERLVTQPYHFDPVLAFGELGVSIQREVAPAELKLRANLDGTRIVDMDHGALAYRVGIRENDRLIKINGEPVATPTDVHRAWRHPVDDRIHVTLERDAQTVVIDEPIPQVEKFIVPAEPWREHNLRGTQPQ